MTRSTRNDWKTISARRLSQLANQDDQLEKLVNRMNDMAADMERQRLDAIAQSEAYEKLHEELSDVYGRLQNRDEEIERMAQTYQRMRGWQDLARELLAGGK